MRARDFPAAQRTCESLLIDYGLSGREALREIHRAIRQEYHHPGMVRILGDADHAMGRAENEFVQVNALIARAIREVFT